MKYSGVQVILFYTLMCLNLLTLYQKPGTDYRDYFIHICSDFPSIIQFYQGFMNVVGEILTVKIY